MEASENETHKIVCLDIGSGYSVDGRNFNWNVTGKKWGGGGGKRRGKNALRRGSNKLDSISLWWRPRRRIMHSSE